MTDYSKQAPYDPSDWVQVERRREVEQEHSQARQSRPSNFVAPAPRPLRPAEIMPAPAQPVDLSPAWQPMTSPGRDSVSAVDRAKAFHIRSIPIYAAIVGMAVAAVILYSVTIAFWGVQINVPLFADRILIFLAVAFGWGLWMFKQANETDYDHSHAGIERLRIETAGDIQLAIVEAETEIKLKALDAYLKLIGVRDDD